MMSTYDLADIDEVRAFGATSESAEFLAVVETIVATIDETDETDTDEDLLVRAVDGVTIALADFDLSTPDAAFFLDGFAATPVAAGVWTALRDERDALNLAMAA